jgi:hypothetical protein
MYMRSNGSTTNVSQIPCGTPNVLGIVTKQVGLSIHASKLCPVLVPAGKSRLRFISLPQSLQ